MIILSSDTSTKSISVCVMENEKILAEHTEDMGMTHSTTHMPLIEKILLQAKISINDVDLFCCTVGPGSYTGIRIGVTTTKAMAYAADKSAVGVSTLMVLAKEQNKGNTLICPVLDARNRRVFAAGFFNENIVIPEGNYNLDDFLEEIKSFCENKKYDKKINLLFCGDAANNCQKDLGVESAVAMLEEKNLIKEVSYLFTFPKARYAGLIAMNKFNDCKGDFNKEYSPFNLNANYISKSAAQRLKDRK